MNVYKIETVDERVGFILTHSLQGALEYYGRIHHGAPPTSITLIAPDVLIADVYKLVPVERPAKVST